MIFILVIFPDREGWLVHGFVFIKFPCPLPSPYPTPSTSYHTQQFIIKTTLYWIKSKITETEIVWGHTYHTWILCSRLVISPIMLLCWGCRVVLRIRMVWGWRWHETVIVIWWIRHTLTCTLWKSIVAHWWCIHVTVVLWWRRRIRISRRSTKKKGKR